MFSKVWLGGYSKSEVDAHCQQAAQQLETCAQQLDRLKQRCQQLERTQHTTIRALLVHHLEELFCAQPTEGLAAVLRDLPVLHQAFLLSQLSPAAAGAVLLEQPAEERVAVLAALSRPQLIDEAEGVALIQAFLDRYGAEKKVNFQVGGMAALADILGTIGQAWPTVRSELSAHGLTETVAALDSRLVTLQDVADWSRQSLYSLLKLLDRDVLLVVLQHGPAQLRERILSECVSRRAAEDLREELALSAPHAAQRIDASIASFLSCAQKLHTD